MVPTSEDFIWNVKSQKVMNTINVVPSRVLSTITMDPPNQSKPPMTPIPINSLNGDARFCLFNNLFEKLKNFEVDLIFVFDSVLNLLNLHFFIDNNSFFLLTINN